MSRGKQGRIEKYIVPDLRRAGRNGYDKLPGGQIGERKLKNKIEKRSVRSRIGTPPKKLFLQLGTGYDFTMLNYALLPANLKITF